jgi:hypothetical protein
MPFIVWVCQKARCNQLKENALESGLKIVFYLQIALNEWLNNTKQL